MCVSLADTTESKYGRVLVLVNWREGQFMECRRCCPCEDKGNVMSGHKHDCYLENGNNLIHESYLMCCE